ncbi:MAG: cyclic nucleotide-binding domain-containing protein [Elusimicrobia bacterium]|nr:cyclic nucleotide-binding domain-containing protein [Candidatus Liberimonas magnetica]
MYNSGDFLLLRQVEVLKGLSDDDLKKMLELTFIKDYPTGTVLFNEGMIGDVMYLIINGIVQLSRRNENNEVIVLADLKDGGFFGEMSLIENEKRTAAAKISVPTKMLVITRRSFQQMLETNPAVSSKLLMVFLKVMSHRLRMTMKH